MKNYISVGPVSIKLSNRHLAGWGFPSVCIGGLSFLCRASNRALILASYHPRSSGTWYWSISIAKSGINRKLVRRAERRTGQWHDYYRLPFNRELVVSRQDYHMPRKNTEIIFTCRRCEANYHVAEAMDECPVCGTYK